MKERVSETFGFLKTTAIGGLIFLLPVAVIGGLLGYVYNVVVVVYEPLKEHLPVSSLGGTALLFLIATCLSLLPLSPALAVEIFGPRVTVREAGPPLALAIGDFNRDGHPDVATACPSVVLGDGLGGLTHSYSSGRLGGLTSVAVDDALHVNEQPSGMDPLVFQPGVPPYLINLPIENNVVPLPPNGSTTRSPGLLEIRMIRPSNCSGIWQP